MLLHSQDMHRAVSHAMRGDRILQSSPRLHQIVCVDCAAWVCPCVCTTDLQCTLAGTSARARSPCVRCGGCAETPAPSRCPVQSASLGRAAACRPGQVSWHEERPDGLSLWFSQLACRRQQLFCMDLLSALRAIGIAPGSRRRLCGLPDNTEVISHDDHGARPPQCSWALMIKEARAALEDPHPLYHRSRPSLSLRSAFCRSPASMNLPEGRCCRQSLARPAEYDDMADTGRCVGSRLLQLVQFERHA